MVVTKAYVLVSQQLDIVYEAILKTCDEFGWKIKDNRRNEEGNVGYQIRAKLGVIGQEFHINIQDRQSNRLIDIHNFPNVYYFFKALVKYLPLESGFRVYNASEPNHIFDIPTYANEMHNNILTVPKDLLRGNMYAIEIISSDIPELQGSKELYVHKRDPESVLYFGKGKKVLFTIPIKQIKHVMASSMEKGRLRKDTFVIDIIFSRAQETSLDVQQNSIALIRIDVEDEYASKLQRQVLSIRDEELGLRNIVWVDDKFKPCTICSKNNVNFDLSSNNLCIKCFESKYGKILLTHLAQYHGGHKAYIAGGTWSDYEYGKLYMTEHYLIFAKGDKKDPYKRWEIVIPLNSVIMDKWGVEEEARRKIISGIGGSTENFGVAGGTIRESGKAHHIIVPYIDQNGVPQEPRFGVSSFRGKAIRELASKLYEQIVKEKNSTTTTQIPSPNVGVQPTVNPDNQASDDPIRVLKVRFARGEISKEEYEEMKKVLDA